MEKTVEYSTEPSFVSPTYEKVKLYSFWNVDISFSVTHLYGSQIALFQDIIGTNDVSPQTISVEGQTSWQKVLILFECNMIVHLINTAHTWLSTDLFPIFLLMSVFLGECTEQSWNIC